MRQYSTLLALAIIAFGFSSCLQDKCDATRTYTQWNPIYLTQQELRQDIAMEGPRELENPGKIYYYRDVLLINESKEGIHFFDNSDPANPVALSFLPIQGNVDMAIRNDRLYADSYVDLLTFNISDPKNPVLLSRSEEVFDHHGFNDAQGYVVGYEETSVTEDVDCGQEWGDFFWRGDILFLGSGVEFDAINVANNSSTPGNSVVGTGGSLARFTIAKDVLYTVSEYDLKVFSLDNPDAPEYLNNSYIGWAMETIFPYGDILFIGARNGMHIVDIIEPKEPVYRSSFWHTTACDPVYVNGDVAYVTLRDGTECEGFSNQLDVVNVENLDNPYLIESYEMHHPIGLSIFKDHLYLCEDDKGLKVFDASEPRLVGERQVFHDDDFTAIDVITLRAEEIALVIGADGLYQFDISTPDNPKFLSRISVEN